MMLARIVVVLVAGLSGLVTLAPGLWAQPSKPPAKLEPNQELAEKLKAVREEHKLPALWGAIVEGDRVIAIAAVGVRKADAKEAVTIHDRVHIGSDTKAMTATLLAFLVEKKKLRWDSTVAEVFPDLKGKIHEDLRGVTVTQLLTHEAGLKANIIWLPTPDGTTLRADRRNKVARILKDAPQEKPGTKFLYSNCGYVVAAAMAEEVAGEGYEHLTRTMLFKPLGMATAGFGPPGAKGKIEQPWGHEYMGDKLVSNQFDNPPIMAPAGAAHCSMADWAKFASAHLLGAQGKGALLKPETFKHLHTPREGFNYAGGWLVVPNERVLTHDGSNTRWYARVQLHPKESIGFLVATNVGGDGAKKAVDAAVKVLNDFHLAHRDKK